jgi:predicted nucleic acid-binding protein
MESNNFVDTIILILILSGNKKIISFIEHKELHISFITQMELLSKSLLIKTDIRNINLLIETCKLYDLNEAIKQNAILLMRNNRLKLPDAIIAATSNYYKLKLLTGDRKFEKISNVEIITI